MDIFVKFRIKLTKAYLIRQYKIKSDCFIIIERYKVDLKLLLGSYFMLKVNLRVKQAFIKIQIINKAY